jgi:hypothetical protein
MFVHPQHGIRLLVYVDDVGAAAKEQREIDWFFRKLSGRFNAKNLGRRFIRFSAYEFHVTGNPEASTLIRNSTFGQCSRSLGSEKRRTRTRRFLWLITSNFGLQLTTIPEST